MSLAGESLLCLLNDHHDILLPSNLVPRKDEANWPHTFHFFIGIQVVEILGLHLS